ncbi:MAG: hypothetical protein P8J37_15765 [Fuerstiella sp.]|nr:hypothetical protein [Fuerstiella sp.]
MTENPYEPGTAAKPTSTKGPGHWMIRAGIALLILAGICLAMTVVGMMLAFDSIANNATTPSPSDLAQGINLASLPSFAAVPLAILGVALLICGFFVRRKHS